MPMSSPFFQFLYNKQDVADKWALVYYLTLPDCYVDLSMSYWDLDTARLQSVMIPRYQRLEVSHMLPHAAKPIGQEPFQLYNSQQLLLQPAQTNDPVT